MRFVTKYMNRSSLIAHRESLIANPESRITNHESRIPLRNPESNL
jgi:hypothetical protein